MRIRDGLTYCNPHYAVTMRPELRRTLLLIYILNPMTNDPFYDLKNVILINLYVFNLNILADAIAGLLDFFQFSDSK